MTHFSVFPLDNSIGRMVYLTARELKAHLNRSFRQHGHEISPEHWAVLNILWEKDGLHQNELSYRAFKDRHNISRILTLLQRKGLIMRRPHDKDARKYNIYLTPKGRMLKPRLIAITTRHLQKAFQGLSEKEIVGLRRMLEQVLKNLGAPLKG